MPPPERVGRDVGIRRSRKRPRPPVDPVQLELCPELVQHRQCDAAVRRQLPARDGDHPERPRREHRLALRPRGRDRAGRQHADAGEARADRAERTDLQGEAGLGQDLALLRFGRLDRAGVSLEGGVRGPDEHATGPGDGEGDARPVDRDRDRGAPAAVALEHEVCASAQRHRGARTRVLEPPNVVEPRPGGVHDRARFDLERLAGERVAQVGDGTALEAVELDAVEHDGACVGGAAQVREAEPGVVGLGVGIEAGGAEAVEPERRDELRRGGGRDHASPLRDGAGQARVRPERAADRDPPVRPAAIDGEQEVQRPHEVGCDEPAERVHLGERLADEAEVAEAEVAQPAVDQLRRRARRARCEVVALDERDPEPVAGGDLGDAGSDDPAADDEQVEPSRPQALERGCSLAHRCDDTHPAWVKSRHPGRRTMIPSMKAGVAHP